jgi:hypothetical protein
VVLEPSLYPKMCLCSGPILCLSLACTIQSITFPRPSWCQGGTFLGYWLDDHRLPGRGKSALCPGVIDQLAQLVWRGIIDHFISMMIFAQCRLLVLGQCLNKLDEVEGGVCGVWFSGLELHLTFSSWCQGLLGMPDIVW